MLLLSFVLLLLAALLGTVIAGLHLNAGHTLRLRWPVWGLHAMLGVAGFGALLVGLRGPPHGVAMGVGSFGRIAAVLLAIALLAGGVILVGRLRYRRLPVLVVGLHATIAVGGVVVLAAYTLVH